VSKYSEDFRQFLQDMREARRNRPKMHPAKVRRNWVGVATFAFVLVMFTLMTILAFNVSGWWFFLAPPTIAIAMYGGKIMDWYDWKYNL